MIKKEVLEKVCENIFEEKPPVLQTGFKDLDIILSGVEKSSLITIGARPAMGKSSFATNIMLNLLEQNKKPSLHWTIYGSSCWTRTNDLSVNSRALYQLS